MFTAGSVLAAAPEQGREDEQQPVRGGGKGKERGAKVRTLVRHKRPKATFEGVALSY